MSDQLYLKYLTVDALKNMSEQQLIDLLIEPAIGFDSSWDVNADFASGLDFSWDVGDDGEYYWYRIESCCVKPTCVESGIDPGDERCETTAVIQGDEVQQGFRFLTFMAAKSLSDLCELLQSNDLTPPVNTNICSIRRYSRPVFKENWTDWATAGHGYTSSKGDTSGGRIRQPINNSCNTLVEEEFRDVPECLEYAIGGDFVVEGGGYAHVWEVFLDTEMVGGITMSGEAVIPQPVYGMTPSGTITMSGAATVSASAFTVVMDGGIACEGGVEGILISSLSREMSGGIVMSGSVVVSTSISWTYEMSSGIEMGGFGTPSLQLSYSSSGNIVLSGSATIEGADYHFEGQASGGVVMSGAAEALSSAYVLGASGEVEVYGEVGEVKSSAWSYTGSGSVLTDGEARISYFPVMSGTITMSGLGVVNLILGEAMTGGIVMGGGIGPALSAGWGWTMDGGIVMSGKHAGSWLGNFYAFADGGEAEISYVEIEFRNIEAGDLEPSSSVVVVDCGCGDLPLTLNFISNIAQNNVLSDFLQRNGYTLARETTLRYQRGYWRQHLHFIGYGSHSVSEKWTIVYEWGCVDTVGAEEIGTKQWQFSMLVRRKDMVLGTDSDTRYLVTIPAYESLSPCVDGNTLDVEVILNTQTGDTSLLKGVPDDVIFSDGIGLFKTPGWIDYPSASFRIRELPLEDLSPTYDISTIFPDPPHNDLVVEQVVLDLAPYLVLHNYLMLCSGFMWH